MKKPARSKNARSVRQIKRGGVVLFFLCSFSALHGAGVEDSPKVHLLQAQEFAVAKTKAEAVAMPDRSEPLQFDKAQAFVVDMPSVGSFWLVPVRYESENPVRGYFSPRCGVFVVWPTGGTQFVRTIGYGRTSIYRCNKLTGVGFMPSQASTPPRILLLYDTRAPNATIQEPEVLGWEPSKAGFVEDDGLSQRLEDDEWVRDIVSMKRQLKRYQ